MLSNTLMLEMVGLVAGFCTTLSFLPQALQVIKTRNTTSISLMMYVVFVTGVTLWIIYGVLISSLPLLMWNFFTLLLAGTILRLKLRYG
ncbi:MAG: glutathione synthetase [Gammaproteobacteria bacterium]|uniref:SemiSWEET transporter n=1 Tax=Pseudomaricurvus alcaniphilus TaxID=1166482 RepID=UPI00140971EC|nr:SemiSWEET transporter [Pseudomaricurvus alcaniphilus]MBR9912253.1 glutathione synthetase [Gammaproteobacteria bacterium]NHN37370.1 glutathione synthetase [Pseudomaricurvus alcaniphilus]